MKNNIKKFDTWENVKRVFFATIPAEKERENNEGRFYWKTARQKAAFLESCFKALDNPELKEFAVKAGILKDNRVNLERLETALYTLYVVQFRNMFFEEFQNVFFYNSAIINTVRYCRGKKCRTFQNTWTA